MPRKKKEETSTSEIEIPNSTQAVASETENMLEMVSKKKIELVEPGTVSFPCPKCGKSIISRTLHERMIATKYRCEKCGFEGPN